MEAIELSSLSPDLTKRSLTMLRNKPSTRTVTTKQASLMADHQPPKPNYYTCHCSSLFTSPKYRFFTSKMNPFDSDFSLISPSSILEPNPSFFSSKPTSYFERTSTPHPQRFHPPEANGLADLVTNRDTNKDQSRKPVLRVQIPSADFGTRTGLRYHCQLSPCVQTKVLTGGMTPVSETEDYTRVISHGPNPTITHIFDNSVFVETTPLPSPLAMEINNNNFKKTENFLSYCYTCNKSLDQKQDIYIYRGDKGFCSSECRHQEMLLDQMES